MAKLLMLKGLPGSGKSTRAKELVAKGYVRVNNDELREMLHNGKWSKSNERYIFSLRNHIINMALSDNLNVVVDNLNLHPKHKAHLELVAKEHNATFEEEFIDTPLEECIKRDLTRPKSVGEKVIRRWYNDYLKPNDAVYVAPAGKPKAIIVDIDGTLAHMNGRSPYDESKVGEDTVDEAVRDLINYYHYDYEIILVSGRHNNCGDDTAEWLRLNDVKYDWLLMRPAEDSRSDVIVKREIFDQHIRDNYQVAFVLDDRNRVVEMWRSLGLKCLQVAEGDF